MSKGMHWVYLIIISILLILVWQERQLPGVSDRAEEPQRTSAADELVPAESDRNIDVLLELMNSLQEDNRRLAAQVELLEQQLVEQELAHEVANGELREDRSEPESEEARQRRERIERAQSMVLDGDELRERVENEEVDPAWAYDMELALEDLFRGNEALRDLDIHSIQCRSTVCAIDIQTDNSVVGGLNIPVLFRQLNQAEWFSEGNYGLISISETESDIDRIMIVRREPNGG